MYVNRTQSDRGSPVLIPYFPDSNVREDVNPKNCTHYTFCASATQAKATDPDKKTWPPHLQTADAAAG